MSEGNGIADRHPTSPHHDSRGRFAKGNRASIAERNPLCTQVFKLKEAFVSAITPEDMRAVTLRLLAACRDDDARVAVQAQELLFNRLWGKAVTAIALDIQGAEQAAPVRLSDTELDSVLRIMEQAANRPPALEVESVRRPDPSVR